MAGNHKLMARRALAGESLPTYLNSDTSLGRQITNTYHVNLPVFTRHRGFQRDGNSGSNRDDGSGCQPGIEQRTGTVQEYRSARAANRRHAAGAHRVLSCCMLFIPVWQAALPGGRGGDQKDGDQTIRAGSVTCPAR